MVLVGFESTEYETSVREKRLVSKRCGAPLWPKKDEEVIKREGSSLLLNGWESGWVVKFYHSYDVE